MNCARQRRDKAKESWSVGQTEPRQAICAGPHQEPVDIHEQQRKKESVEEEVERDGRDGLDAGYTGGVQHFQREPVETEPEPETGEGKKTQFGWIHPREL